MTALLFRSDPYLKRASAVVTGHTDEGGLILNRSLFYPQGGGQPGDSGVVEWADGSLVIASAVKGQGDAVVLVPGAPVELPAVGTEVSQMLDWERRLRHMRIHTALHLLSVAIPLPVSGGSIGTEKGRLDFVMPQAIVDKEALALSINEMIRRNLPVTESWIADAELAATPGLVKTMSVRPPSGQGRVRLVAIGEGAARIDLQPCGGTHVARTAEIGAIRIGKIENKGRQNRQVNLWLDDK
ncbi:MAG: alanyl-tRNA editing protein [Paracoccaceae bacterium]